MQDTDLSFSQNFIKNNKIVEDLIQSSSITKKDLVIEIGTGKGKITKLLSENAKDVISIEKDKILFDRLVINMKYFKNVTLIHSDFIDYTLPKEGPYKVFSNIPFNQTAAITRRLLENPNPPTDTYLFMQREAAERFIGDNRKESQISLLVRPMFDTGIVYDFQRDDFTPVPSVDIVLARFQRRKKPDVSDLKRYREFIVFGFNSWASNIWEAYRDIFTATQRRRLSRDLGFQNASKPSELRYEQWLGLYNYFEIGTDKKRKKIISDFYRDYKRNSSKVVKDHRTSFSE